MTSELSIDMNNHVYGAYVMGTKWFTKHCNFEIVCETRLNLNLLTNWHDTLVGMSMYDSANYDKSSLSSSK